MITANTTRAPLDAEYMIYSLLRVDGGPAGSPEMNVASATDFEYIAPAGATAFIERVLFTAQNTAMLPAKFIGLTALTNGLTVKVLNSDDEEIFDFLNGLTIKDNTDFGLLAGPDAPIRDTSQVQQDELIVRWTIGRSGHVLRLPAGWKFQVKVQDNLSAITKLRVQVQGWLEPLNR